MFPRTSNILHTPHLYLSLFPRGYSAIQLALAPNFSVNQLAGKADMGSLVHSSECGKATAVFEVSFHLDVVAENCIYLWFQALEVVFSCTKYYSIDCCCSQVLFLLLQKHKLARTCTTTSFFQDFLVARTQLGSNSVDCVPLLFRCSVQEGSCCCNSTAITCKVSARASEFCCACFDCRHKGGEELIF